MNFDFDEDQEMIKSLAERFVAERYDIDRRKKYLSEPMGFGSENWALLGELGLIAAAFDETSGGMGLDCASLAIIFEALGRGLVVEPLTENVILAAKLFEAVADEHQKSAWLDGVVTGEKRLALAHFEPEARGRIDKVQTRATTKDEHILLSGQKSLIASGAGVDAFLISALDSEKDEVALFLVDAKTPGLMIQHVRTVDGGKGVALQFDALQISSDSRLNGGIEDVKRAHAKATLSRTAEALGIMEKMFADTLEYLRTRDQFGRKLADFQVLQHRMVDQYAVLEQSRALLLIAIMAEKKNEADWYRAIDGARAFIAKNSLKLGHEMIQLHGGMGVTDELFVSTAHKRLLMLSRYPEPASISFDRYAAAPASSIAS